MWIFLRYNFAKLLSYLKSAPSIYEKWKVSCKTRKFQIWNQFLYQNANFRAKKFLNLRLITIIMTDNYYHIWNQHPWTFQNEKNFVQKKKSQIWNQNTLIGYFLGCKFEKLSLYLKSALSNFSKKFVLK